MSGSSMRPFADVLIDKLLDPNDAFGKFVPSNRGMRLIEIRSHGASQNNPAAQSALKGQLLLFTLFSSEVTKFATS